MRGENNMQEMTPEQLAALQIPMGDAQAIFERRFEDEDVQVAGEICKDVTQYLMQKHKGAKRDHVGSAIMALALATVAGAIYVVRGGPDIGSVEYDA
jgi:hypothetical protein